MTCSTVDIGEDIDHKVPVFGATSILGFNLCRLFADRFHAYIPARKTGRDDMPSSTLLLEDSDWIRDTLAGHSSSLLIYTHAICHVGNCEKNPDWAYEINVNHIRRLMGVLPEQHRLVYVSSDHVFGEDGCYSEQSTPCPISVYGETRVAAEELVLGRANTLVIRHGLPVGPSFDGRTGHLDWLRYRSENQLPLTLVEDEARSAVPIEALCERVVALAHSDECGIRHVPATRLVSRPELAKVLSQRLNISPQFGRTTRAQQSAPHLGRIALRTDYAGLLSEPIVSAADCPMIG